MKSMRKFLALAMVFVMLTGLAISASAASITINQDDSYEGTAGEAGRVYKYYKVFSASYAEDFDPNFDGGYDEDGVAVTEAGSGKASYTATAAVAGKLGTINAETHAWTTNAGNKWFDLAYSAGTNNYVVTWRDGVATDAATLQEAAAWLIANSAYESGPTELSFADGSWTSGEVDPGYYVISSDTGNNLAAVTTDVEIDEKNAYPPILKEQEDEDLEEPTGEALNVAVGDSITYTATVSIPKTAKVGDKMVVKDTPSIGLTYNNDVTATGNATIEYGTATGDVAWTATITVTEASKGTDVVFTYTMTVNEDALIDGDKINTFDLKYGDKYNSVPETVEYKTYFTGIEKVDGDNKTIKLEGVEFTLAENDVEFKVSKSDDGYYYPDANGSATVVTDKDGIIIIRGLDNDKTYTLTETANPNPGYNMLAAPVTLTLVEDKADDAYTTAKFDQVENNSGTILPSTGGIGTTLFYVFGTLLVLGAGVVLVTKRRVRE